MTAWADACAMEVSTLKRALAKIERHPEQEEMIPFSTIKTALFGEQHVEEVKNARLRNEKLEREAAVANGELLSADFVTEWIQSNAVIPISNLLNAMPMMLAQACNPQDPERARKAIFEWREKVMKPALLKAMMKGVKQ